MKQNSEDCTLVREKLSEYLDGRLDSNIAADTKAHLDSCGSCRRELAGLRQTVALLNKMPMAPLPRSFLLSQDQVKRPARLAWWQAPVVWRSASAVATFFLAVLMVGDYFGVVGPVPAKIPLSEPNNIVITGSDAPDKSLAGSTAIATAEPAFTVTIEPTPLQSLLPTLSPTRLPVDLPAETPAPSSTARSGGGYIYGAQPEPTEGAQPTPNTIAAPTPDGQPKPDAPADTPAPFAGSNIGSGGVAGTPETQTVDSTAEPVAGNPDTTETRDSAAKAQTENAPRSLSLLTWEVALACVVALFGVTSILMWRRAGGMVGKERK